MASLLGALQRVTARHPLLTTSVSGFFIAAVGDVGCQKAFEHTEQVDWTRTGEMGIIRATVMAPFLFFYFPRLAAAFPGTSAFAVARRIAADQILGSPVAISMVFMASSAIQGDITQAPQRIQQQLLPTWLNGLTYWPFAHTITFKFVPVAYQAHFANFLSVYWNMVSVSSCLAWSYCDAAIRCLFFRHRCCHTAQISSCNHQLQQSLWMMEALQLRRKQFSHQPMVIQSQDESMIRRRLGQLTNA